MAVCTLLSSTTIFDFHFRDEIDPILGAAIHFGVAFLPAETADLGDGHSSNALFDQGVLHVLQLEVADDRFNFLHSLGSSSIDLFCESASVATVHSREIQACLWFYLNES